MPRSGGRGFSGPRASSPAPSRATPLTRAAPPPRMRSTPPPPRKEVHHHHHGSPPPNARPSTSAQQAAPHAAPAAAAPAAPGAPKAPGLMAQMAATAGGVAIGSTVGHVVGHALTSGGSNGENANHQVGTNSEGYASPPPTAPRMAAPSEYSPAADMFAGSGSIDDGSLASTMQRGPCAPILEDLLSCLLRSTEVEGCADQFAGLRECATQNQISM